MLAVDWLNHFLTDEAPMPPLTANERSAANSLIAMALAEDLGAAGDITSQATIPEAAKGRAEFIARSQGTIAGLPIAQLVFAAVDPAMSFTATLSDGQTVARGDVIAVVAGPMRSLLTGERTALNFLQRLCGVATLTRQFVQVAGDRVQVLDTRKTTPGWRLLEKYAVRVGGGHNHRIGLFDAVLIKDNHLAALGGGPAAVTLAVNAARKHAPVATIEVEVETLEQLESALTCGPDIILLDNMPSERLRECVARRNAVAPRILLEASGGVSLSTIAGIAATGVNRISVGALTHSAIALDIALDYRSDPV